MSDSTISVSPVSYSFGILPKNVSATKVFRITNTSADGTLILGQIGAMVLPFYASGVWPSDSTIDPAGFVDATVGYGPTVLSTGSSDYIEIPSNDPNAAVTNVFVDGTCQQAVITLTPSTKDFGDQTKNSLSYELVTVTNTGNIDMTVGALSGFAPPYTVSSDNVSGATIHPSDPITYAFVAGYNPTVLGLSDSTLTVPNSDTTQLFIVNGNCTEADISVLPVSKSFGILKKNESASQVFRMTNNGNKNLTINNISAPSSPFSRAGGAVLDATVAPGGYYDATAYYNPSVLSTGSADSMIVLSNDPDSPAYVITLDGTCQQAVVSVSPTAKDFGSKRNLSVTDQTVSVYNFGNVNMTVGTLSGLGAPYSMVSDGVSGQTMAPDSTKTVVVRYSPTTRGLSDSTMIIPNSDTTQNFITNGNATAAYSVIPSSPKSFGIVAELTTTDTTVTVSNLSTGALIMGATSGITPPYSIVNNSVTGATIPGLGSATMVVRYQPTAVGSSDSTITLPNNDLAQTYIVQGVCKDCDISISPTYKNFGSMYRRFGIPLVNDYVDVTVTNIGTSPLRMQAITPSATRSYFLSNDNVSNATLSPAGTATVRINHIPSALGNEDSSVIFNSNDPDTAAYSMPLYSVGLGV